MSWDPKHTDLLLDEWGMVNCKGVGSPGSNGDKMILLMLMLLLVICLGLMLQNPDGASQDSITCRSIDQT